MLFNVIVVTFIMTLLMYTFTNTAIPTYLSFIQMPIIEANFGIFSIQNILVMNFFHERNAWKIT